MAKDPITAGINLVIGAFKWMSPSARRERVENSLISTLDGFAKWLGISRIKTGKYSDDKKANDYLDHFMRQYDANRPKLK